MIGNTGTNGTRKPRSRSGWVRRSTTTPMLTITNANSVPMFTSLASSASGRKAASAAMPRPKTTVVLAGVLRAVSRPKNFGTSPSRDIANMIRVCP